MHISAPTAPTQPGICFCKLQTISGMYRTVFYLFLRITELDCIKDCGIAFLGIDFCIPKDTKNIVENAFFEISGFCILRYTKIVRTTARRYYCVLQLWFSGQAFPRDFQPKLPAANHFFPPRSPEFPSDDQHPPTYLTQHKS